MSHYPYEPAQHALIVSWPSGRGDIEATNSEVGDDVTDDDAISLTRSLARLSEELWPPNPVRRTLILTQDGVFVPEW
jgi:hypothetical protein